MSKGSTQFTANSNTPLPRSTMAQEKIRTSEFDQNGRMIRRKSASRERPWITFANTKAQGKPTSTQITVTVRPSLIDFHKSEA